MALELPIFCIVGARPVKAVATPQGGMDVLAYEWDTGRMVRNMGYLTRILIGDGELDYVSEAEFEQAVARLRAERG